MMDMFSGSHGWGMGGGMWVFPILFWVLVIVGIIFVARGFSGQKNDSLSPPPPDETPLTILQQRFAKGEIDQDTYNRMKLELKD